MTDRVLDNLITDYKTQLRTLDRLGMTKEQAEYILGIEHDLDTVLHISIAVSLLAHISKAHKVMEGTE